jgi:hypothetical protein
MLQFKYSNAFRIYQLNQPLQSGPHIGIEKHKLNLQAGQEIRLELMASV